MRLRLTREIVGRTFPLAPPHNSPSFHRPALGHNYSALAFAPPAVVIDHHPIACLIRLMRVRGVGKKSCVMPIPSCGAQNRQPGLMFRIEPPWRDLRLRSSFASRARMPLARQSHRNLFPPLSPELIEIRSAGNEALYNLDYATAREKLTKLRDRLPQHPAGDLNLAVLVWMEHLYKTRRLQTTLYTQEGFYAGGTKSKEGDQVEAGVDKAFRDHIACPTKRYGGCRSSIVTEYFRGF